jgi:hypothetical protein
MQVAKQAKIEVKCGRLLMARIVKEVEIGGRNLRTLFDTGHLRSYIKAEFYPPGTRNVKPITVGLGGEIHQLDERRDLSAVSARQGEL